MNNKKPASAWAHRKPSEATERQPASKGRANSKALPVEETVYGIHAASAALANPARTVKAVYATENGEAKLQHALESRKVVVLESEPAELDGLVGAGAVHQGVVLHVQALAQPDLGAFLDRFDETSLVSVVMLDQVTDPQNIGAVLRSAAAFGVDALILQSRHSPSLSGALAKAASGALEHVAVIETVNLARTLEELKDHGFHCVGFDSDAPRQFEASTIAGQRRVVFVFGSEDKGLRRLVREACDEVCTLAAPGKIKSLNVSNAAAIVFYEAARRVSEATLKK